MSGFTERRRARTWTAAGLAAAGLGGWSVPALVASGGDDSARRSVVCVVEDERITESSGLVLRGAVMWTVNDSGNGAFLYGLDPGTCRTVRVTTFATTDPVDVEALAPGPDGVLWVGDIGDNGRTRGSVTVHRVPARDRGAARHFELVYPDGPHDAEALLVHPRTGRVLVVTKGPFVAGAVYRAPARLRSGEVHRLERLGPAPALVTDGAFTPDGRHLVLRDYGSATVLRFPSLTPVGSFPLPRQEQGEGLALVGNRVWLSSEGVGRPVLSVAIPARLGLSTAAGPGRGGGRAPEAAQPSDGRSATAADRTEPGEGTGWVRLAGLVAAIGSAVLIVLGFLLRVLLRAARRRGPRSS